LFQTVLRERLAPARTSTTRPARDRAAVFRPVGPQAGVKGDSGCANSTPTHTKPGRPIRAGPLWMSAADGEGRVGLGRVHGGTDR